MACRRKRPAVVHCRAHGHPGRHLVVQQTADFSREQRRQLLIQLFIGTSAVRIDTARQIALEVLEHGRRFPSVTNDNEQGCGSKGFGLQCLRIGKKCLSGDAQQRVRVTCRRHRHVGGQELGPGAAQYLDARPVATEEDSNAGVAADPNAPFTSETN